MREQTPAKVSIRCLVYNHASYIRDCLEGIVRQETNLTGGGLWIHTASIIYKPELLHPYPDFCRKCHVGDYPLQIMMGIRGKVYFMAERMVTYRFMHPSSWTFNNNILDTSFYPKWLSEINMLLGMNELTAGKHHDLFYKQIASYSLMIAKRCHSLAKLFVKAIPEIPLYLNKKERRDFWKMRWGIKGLNRKIKAFLRRKFLTRQSTR